MTSHCNCWCRYIIEKFGGGGGKSLGGEVSGVDGGGDRHGNDQGVSSDDECQDPVKKYNIEISDSEEEPDYDEDSSEEGMI